MSIDLPVDQVVSAHYLVIIMPNIKLNTLVKHN